MELRADYCLIRGQISLGRSDQRSLKPILPILPILQDLVSFFQGKRFCKIAISFKISVWFRLVHLFFYNSKRTIGDVSCLSCLYLKKIEHFFDFFYRLNPFSCKSCKIAIFTARILQDKHFLQESGRIFQDNHPVSPGVLFGMV